MKKYYLIFFIFSSYFCSSEKLDKDVFLDFLKSYQNKKTIQANVNKTFFQPLIKRKSKSTGLIYYSQGKWRLDILQPQKLSILFDGKKIQYKINNTVHNISKPHSNIFSLLFDTNKFFNTFKYAQTQKKGRTRIHHFLGKPSSRMKTLEIQIEKDRILSLKIQWNENLGQEYYKFTSIRFNQTLRKKLFKPFSE